MSFGFGVGDFVTVGQLCWNVYKKCKDSPGNYADLSTEVGNLHNVIKETDELLSQQQLTTDEKAKLITCRQGCEDVLKDLDGLLVKYQNLGTKAQRAFDRAGFGMQDMVGIRLRLISNVSILDAFNNTSSHARLENKLNLLIAEVRAGKREGSVVSTKAFDTAVQNDRETWEALGRELEDIGISASIITEKRPFIIAWFQEAVKAGRLEEDAPSDDNDSAISLYEPDSPVGISDKDSIPDSVTDREMASLMREPGTTEASTDKESVPKAQHARMPTAETPRRYPSSRKAPPPPPSQGEEKPRMRPFFLKKLRSRDKQIPGAAVPPGAAMPGDCLYPMSHDRKGLASWL
ncbi:MAG: hypothetical protein ASARMPRED_005318 [Alectoria sarmentosa]|nr:MAG: hypothetical protein ASARMPRED_005318 [Alectoria sarmentosa]